MLNQTCISSEGRDTALHRTADVIQDRVEVARSVVDQAALASTEAAAHSRHSVLRHSSITVEAVFKAPPVSASSMGVNNINHVFPALSWWTVPAKLSQGIPFQAPPATVTVTTGAFSNLGWGGHLKIHNLSFLFIDLWQAKKLWLHINVLELPAVHLTLWHLQDSRGQVVKVECENSTAVTHLNKRGRGTRSWTLWQSCSVSPCSIR